MHKHIVHKVMFKNYYYLIGVPQKATENDIKVAIESLEGKRSASLLYEIKMILLTKQLRELYDLEYSSFCSCDEVNKKNYEIQNELLKKELERLYAEQNISAEMANDSFVKEEKKRRFIKKSLLYIVIAWIILSLVTCAANAFYRTTHGLY